jgi:hypothetical protein
MKNYRLILPDDLYRYEKRVLERIFGPKRDNIKEGQSKLYKEMFHYLYSSPNTWMIKLNTVRRVEHAARNGDIRNRHKILVSKPEGKRPLGRRSCR